MRPLLVALVLAACGPGESQHPDPRLRSSEAHGVAASPSRGTFGATGFNAFILAAAQTFGQADYLWSGDGVTRDILYQGTLIATPYAPGKCHCVGATLQVYMTAFEEWDKQYGGSSGSLKGLSTAQVKQLKQIWFVATPDETGSQGALASLGLGTKVTAPAQARQGDPVQLWRNNGSGHSVIFDSWKMEGGQIAGITYFSCQSSGPGFVTETIGSGAKEVTASRIYIVHPLPPVEPPPDLGPPPPTDAGSVDLSWAADATATDSLPPPATDGQAERPDEGCGCTVGAPPSSSWLALLLLLGLIRWRCR